MAPWPGFFSRLGARLPSSSQLSLEGDMLGNPQKYRHINIGKAETKTKTLQRLENQSLSLSLNVIQRKSGTLWRLTYIIGTCSMGGSHSWGCGPLRAPPKFTFFSKTDECFGGSIILRHTHMRYHSVWSYRCMCPDKHSWFSDRPRHTWCYRKWWHWQYVGGRPNSKTLWPNAIDLSVFYQGNDKQIKRVRSLRTCALDEWFLYYYLTIQMQLC